MCLSFTFFVFFPVTFSPTIFQLSLMQPATVSQLIVGIQTAVLHSSLHSVSVYYGAMKSIIVAQSDGQAFLQLSDKGSCEVVAEARTIRAISLAEKHHNNKPCQIMVSTVGLCSFICARNVPGLMVTCCCLLTQWVPFYPASLSKHVFL